MCVVIWVISGGINLGGQVLSFISVLLFQRSGYFCFFLTFYCGRVFFLHLFFRCYHFSTVWSDLRAAVPQGSDVLHYLASSLPSLLTRDVSIGPENMA